MLSLSNGEKRIYPKFKLYLANQNNILLIYGDINIISQAITNENEIIFTLMLLLIKDQHILSISNHPVNVVGQQRVLFIKHMSTGETQTELKSLFPKTIK